VTEEKLRVVSLCSGSKGNCTYVGYKDDGILIDAGMSRAFISKSLSELGTELCKIKGVFVTHEHSDHIKGVDMLCKKDGIPIHMSRISAGARGLFSDETYRCIIRHENEYTFNVSENMRVESFILPHDSRMCVGYRILTPGGSVGIATDIGSLNGYIIEHLSGLDAVVIECNHDRDILWQGSYPYALKQRILADGGHLSNEDCAECIAALAKNGTRKFLLAHMSRENNRPEIAVKVIKERLRTVCGDEVELRVAMQDVLTEIL